MTRRLLPVVCTLLAIALLGACARPGTLVAADQAGAVEPSGVGEWDAFPVDQVPRPIIVAAPGLVEVTGFRSGDAKMAFLSGRVELATRLPQAPASVAVDLPEGRFTFPALRPDEAFASVRAQGSPANGAGSNPPPVRVTTVTLGYAAFSTDRGRLRLPAWLFGGPDLLGPIASPAVGKEAFWHYGEPNNASTVALSQGGRRINYAVPGRGCASLPVMRYRVEVTETATTVALTTIGEIVSTPGPEEKGKPCFAIALPPVPYNVDLAAPLGNRVVVTRPDGPIS